MSLWNLRSKSVLIIDDFAQMRAMLSSMMKNYEPKSVMQAANGKEAIELMHKHKFDLILCDYNLGDGQDGQQILEEAKYQALLPYYSLFIMVTAENTNAMVMGAAEYTPDAYLSKPINKTVLISRLQKLFAKKELLYPLSEALDAGNLNKIIECCDVLLGKKLKFKFEILKVKCETLLELERYDEAQAICDDVMKERDVPWAMMIIGKIHFYKKNYFDAETKFREIIDFDKHFMPAYDWLAKTLDLSAASFDAQEVLMDAIKISPKSILRQRSLAEIAEKNSDAEQVEKARKKVIEIGRTSCLKESSDYTKLAKVYLEKNAPQKAIDILNETSKVFRGDEQVALESTVEMALAYKAMDNQSKYKDSVNNALKITAQKKSLLRGETAIDLARSCMDLGNKEEAQEILTSVAKEYYDNEGLMQKISSLYEESGLGAEGEKLIADAKGEVVKINNQGVDLIKKGEINEAIRLFQVAVREMPENATININMSKALILNMQKNSFNPRIQKQVFEHLDRVLTNDPENATALDLKQQCKDLANN